jgi:hypothetical protein
MFQLSSAAPIEGTSIISVAVAFAVRGGCGADLGKDLAQQIAPGFAWQFRYGFAEIACPL